MNARIWVLWVAGTLLPAQFVGALTPDWIRQIATPAWDRVFDLAIDDQGAVYVAGDTRGNLFASNAGWQDAYLAKFSAAGNLEWGWQSGTGSSDESTVLVTDASGDVVVGGTMDSSEYMFFRKLHSDGTLVWERRPRLLENWGHVRSLDVDGTGDLYFAGFGDEALFGPEPGEVFFGKYSSSGDLLWTQKIDGPNESEWPSVVAVDLLGNNYVSWQDSPGNFVGTLIERFNADGEHKWTLNLATVYGDGFNFSGMDCDEYGNLYVAWNWGSGWVLSSFLTKYDPSGDVKWTVPLPLGRRSRIAVSASGMVYVNQAIDEGRLQVTAVDTTEGGVRWIDEWDVGAGIFSDLFYPPVFDVTATDDRPGTMYVAIGTEGSMGSTSLGNYLPNLGKYDVYLAKFTLPRILDGDFDSDGDVDGADLLAWQRGASPSPLGADDFATWQAAFGAANQPAAPVGVPEPAALVLFFAAGVAALQRSRKDVRSVGRQVRETRG
jgi:hypothetical protein